MAVAHDSATESATWSTTPDPFTFNHVPVGTPKAVLVFIYHGAVSTDLITSVSYGGVAMTRIASALDTTGEPGRSYVYFLGAGIPTGTQSVSIDHTATSTVKIATCVTATANSNTDIAVFNTAQGDQSNPQISLNSSADDTLRYCAIYYGLSGPGFLTILSGMTAV